MKELFPRLEDLYEEEIIKKEAEEIVRFLKEAEVLPNDYRLRVEVMDKIETRDAAESIFSFLLASGSVLAGHFVGYGKETTLLTLLTYLFFSLLLLYRRKRSRYEIVGLHEAEGRIVISYEGCRRIAKQFAKTIGRSLDDKENIIVGIASIVSHEICHEDLMVGKSEEKASACEALIVYHKYKDTLGKELKKYWDWCIRESVNDTNGERTLAYAAGRAYFLNQLEKNGDFIKESLRESLKRLKSLSIEEIYKSFEEYKRKIR